MDIVWIACIAMLWGLMVLMVWGFQKLEGSESSKGGQP